MPNIIFSGNDSDAILLAHAVAAFQRLGTKLTVSYPITQSPIFEAAQNACLEATCSRADDMLATDAVVTVSHLDDSFPTAETAGLYWSYHALFDLQSSIPLLYPVTARSLWQQVISVRLDALPYIASGLREQVRERTASWARPLIGLQTTGGPRGLTAPSNLASVVGDKVGGTLLLLDESVPNIRLPQNGHKAVREIFSGRLDMQHKLAILSACDLVVAVAGDYLSLAPLAGIRAVGVHPSRPHYPTRRHLPHPQHIHVVPGAQTRDLNIRTRLDFNVVECGGRELDAALIASRCADLLDQPRYIVPPEGETGNLGADVLLRQFIDWENGGTKDCSGPVNRHESYDLLLRTMRDRFPCPRIIETGCARYPEDWSGAGYSTYLFGAYLHFLGAGQLTSVDLSEANCDYARRLVRGLPVEIVNRDSIGFLHEIVGPIDVLYLDSLDIEEPRHAEHCLAEVQASLHALHDESLIVIDDNTIRSSGRAGKGAFAIPWLLQNGWELLHDGYQVVLSRTK